MKISDPYLILKMEFSGLKAVISQYTSKKTILNYLNILEESLSKDDKPKVMYALGELCKWYDENIDDICNDEWVSNPDEHLREKNLIERLYKELDDYDFPKIKEKPIESTDKANRVFIVHGHDNEAKINVARMLEQLGLKTVILHEQPDEGKTIIEKIETYTSEVAYAIVLYTECDLGRAKELDESQNKYRARQNVIFEHGLFVGCLGRKKVCALVRGNVEKPGDLDGVVYIQMDDAGAWKMQLCSNMKAAGLEFDANKLI